MNESYEDILSRMKDKFKELSGYEADDASDIGIRLKVLAGELFSSCSSIEWLKRQVFPQTAAGEHLDMHAVQRGLERKDPVKSTGTLTFSRTSPLLYDVTIPEGTVCSTAQEDGIRIITTKRAVLGAGEFSVNVEAEAQEGGVKGNCAAESITVMMTPPPGISEVINSEPFTGGAEGEGDDELRERIIYSYKNIPNGTNSAFYKNEVSKYAGIDSVSVVPKDRGVGTVDIYASANDGSTSAELLERIQNDLNILREINVDIQVSAPTGVTCNIYANLWVKPGYNFVQVKNNCIAAIKNYINLLGIGENMYLAGVGNAMFNVPGVKNYSFVSSNDKTITNKQIAVVGTVTLAEGS